MTQNSATDEHIIRLCNSGEKVAAVKYYKDISGLGLYEAKQYVDALINGTAAPVTAVPPPDAELIRLYASGRKLAAVRLYRDTMKCDLKTATLYVEQLYGTHPADHLVKSREPVSDDIYQLPGQEQKMSFFRKILSFFTGDKA